MPFTDPSATGDFFVAFLGILFEGMPYILLGTIISGLIDAYMPSNLMDRLLPKNPLAAILLSGTLGAVFPVCECAIVPVIRRLVQKGLPLSCAITYMLSAPIVNPIVVISTMSAYSGNDAVFMTMSRVGVAYFVCVLVGIIVQRFSVKTILRPDLYEGINPTERPDEHAFAEKADHKHADHDHDHGAKPAGGDRMVLAMRTAARDFLDTGMYFTIGVLITALYRTQIDQAKIADFASSDVLAVPVMMILSFVLSLCSTSDAFIAAQMVDFSPSSQLAFLTYGPMMDVKLVFMYLAVFRPKFVFSLAVGLFLLIAVIYIQFGNLPLPGT